ncbi:MAG TPA: nicotinate-nucleotide--dimethylbenzimidazole phosphoribosyltransferase [Citreicella sp.]|mgnify:FL=1|jgi:nicotinate-nucleotide--dimethylbenzimidazole phosphoribosyltransferase|nr:nicotinate-nucleotide--dimethylbenzimidazole phosphoribosyltransferase [Citreicella sp.]|tara:strand:- start:502 stop:1524 length:1023 start_codon:yes stop_codon:yes gene_type:complete
MTEHFPLAALTDLAALPARLPRYDEEAARAARDRQASLTKPPGSLGRLETLAIDMAGWRGTSRPQIRKAQALVFAGNHGICAQGVNPFPQEVTAQMVANFHAGGAAINQICAITGADLTVIALDLDHATQDFTQSPAMTEAECLDALNRGAAAVDRAADVLLLGEMGIGNSTVAAALAAACFGGAPGDWTGPGTGSDAAGIAHKAQVIARGLERHAGVSGDGAAILTTLGGREQAAICGAILAARAYRIPVLLDGFICTAAAAPLHVIDPALLDHCIASHRGAEPGHGRLLDAMAKDPVLALDLRLGEGTGAALALGLLRAALACHNGMATFAEAGVTGG